MPGLKEVLPTHIATDSIHQQEIYSNPEEKALLDHIYQAVGNKYWKTGEDGPDDVEIIRISELKGFFTKDSYLGPAFAVASAVTFDAKSLLIKTAQKPSQKIPKNAVFSTWESAKLVLLKAFRDGKLKKLT